MIGMLMLFNVDESTAVTATLLVRLATLWYGVALGALTWTLTTQKLSHMNT